MTAMLKTLTPALCCAGGIIAGTAVATFTMDHSLPVRMLGPLVFAASMLGADMLIARARGAAPRPSGTAIFLALSCLVPGAVNLDAAHFIQDELPADKTRGLVFYCSNPMCRKAPGAARRAQAMGYGNVKVLSAGISGWRAARLPTSSATPAEV